MAMSVEFTVKHTVVTQYWPVDLASDFSAKTTS